MTRRPWYREPTMWLVAGLPLASVIGSFALLWVASGERGTDAAPEKVQRMAQVQQRDLAPDERALALGLSGELRHTDGRLELRLQGDRAKPARLLLRLVHPAQASLDQEWLLLRDGERWIGKGHIEPSQAWHLQVSPPDGEWRLVGRWSTGGEVSMLVPALASE